MDHSANAKVDLERFLFRFDILSRRLVVLSQGKEAPYLLGIDGLNQTVTKAIATLENIEPALAELQIGDADAYHTVRDAFSALSRPIKAMVLSAVNHEHGLQRETTSARSGIFWQVIGYFIGILVSGTILILFLVWQNREANNLLSRAGEAEIRANEVSTHLMFAIESFPDGFALFDQDGKLQICNARYLAIFPKVADIATPGRTVEELARAAVLRGQL